MKKTCEIAHELVATLSSMADEAASKQNHQDAQRLSELAIKAATIANRSAALLKRENQMLVADAVL